MEKLSRNTVWQAAAYLACTGVLWIRLDAFGASEFSGGRITGKLSTIADLGFLLFLVALLLTIFFRRVAAAIALAATMLCLPFYIYILAPGPCRQIFKSEYSIPLQRPFVWNDWAVVGVLSLVIAAFLSLQGLSNARARFVVSADHELPLNDAGSRSLSSPSWNGLSEDVRPPKQSKTPLRGSRLR
jgi:hypothetical protein